MFSRYDRDALVEVINRYLSEELTAFKLDDALSEIGARDQGRNRESGGEPVLVPLR